MSIKIAEHLRQYLNWLQPLTNLSVIYLIERKKYCPDKVPLEILSAALKKDTIVINADI